MKRALDSVNDKILAAAKRRKPDVLVGPLKVPRLVAVSKLKPVASIVEAYEHGQRFFGENYIQELVAKSNDPEILAKCPEIKFHFIGHLQANKVNKLLKVRSLHMVETIDSIRLAEQIDRAFERQLNNTHQPGGGETNDELLSDKLSVMVQVNTSGEEQKNGIQPDEAPKLAEYVHRECKRLRLAGLMTIGKLDGWDSVGPNPDFLRLYQVRDAVSRHLALDPGHLELSMGMSGDFEEAIELGSTNVRVGTMIFGERAPKKQ